MVPIRDVRVKVVRFSPQWVGCTDYCQRLLYVSLVSKHHLVTMLEFLEVPAKILANQSESRSCIQ